jgi:hypothetical protein
MKKILTTIIVAILIFVSICWYFASLYTPSEKTEWGVTFSHTHAEYLGFDWKVMFLDILNDLKPKKLRLMAYWETIESEKGKYDYSQVAEMLVEAEKRNIDVILVLGLKQPRWPECHHPAWYNDLSQPQKDQAQLEYVKNAVAYYKQFKAIKIWQIENEALFSFGEDCPQTSKDLIKQEMKIVKEADPRPILLTDSGELGRWLPSARLQPDIFGSTMYRVVHNPKAGYFKYPLPPLFFEIKAGVVKKFSPVDRIIGVELQAEPWFADDMFKTDLETQYALMNPVIFQEYVKYAKDVGFEENYLWGVEWWYWLAQKHGDWGMWNEGKKILSTE